MEKKKKTFLLFRSRNRLLYVLGEDSMIWPVLVEGDTHERRGTSTVCKVGLVLGLGLLL